MDNVESFLKETKFCDFSNNNITELAEQIGKNCKGDREFAVSDFYWVRDNILYSVGNWQKKASETLTERKGTCTNKANLLVSLLRYKKIPAGYGVMKVYGQTYFGPIALEMLRKFIGEISTHIYPLVYLENKWIKVDPDVDKNLAYNTSYFNPTSKLIEWDGYVDSVINLSENDIISNKFPEADIDVLIEKKPKNARGLLLKVANIYVNFVRNNNIRVSGANEVEILFKKYLREKYPIYFYLFKLTSAFRNIKSN